MVKLPGAPMPVRYNAPGSNDENYYTRDSSDYGFPFLYLASQLRGHLHSSSISMAGNTKVQLAIVRKHHSGDAGFVHRSPGLLPKRHDSTAVHLTKRTELRCGGMSWSWRNW
jgi:hypothetical protein